VSLLSTHPNPGVHIARACQDEGWSVPETSDKQYFSGNGWNDWGVKDYKVSFYRETLSFNVVTGVWSQPTVVPKKIARRQRIKPGFMGGGQMIPSFVSSVTSGRKLFMVWQDVSPQDYYISSTGTAVAELIIWDVWNEVWSSPVPLRGLSTFNVYPSGRSQALSWNQNFFLYSGGEGVVVCQNIVSDPWRQSEFICNNVDSSGVIQSPSAVIEVSTDSSSMTPSEVCD